MQDRLPTIAGEPTETRTLSASSHWYGKEIDIVPLHEFVSPWLKGEHDVSAHLNVYANYNDFPMTTCDNSTIDGTVGHGGIAGFYAYRDIYDEDSRDDAAMKIYLSACNGHEHDYALLGYFCACSQNFDFTTGNGIDFYNLPSTTLDDAVINDSGRKDTLSINLTISNFILLWFASNFLNGIFFRDDALLFDFILISCDVVLFRNDLAISNVIIDEWVLSQNALVEFYFVEVGQFMFDFYLNELVAAIFLFEVNVLWLLHCFISVITID